MRTSTNTTRRVQTAFRLDARLLARVKKAASESNVSVNDFVAARLAEATEDIRTDEELEEERMRTQAFLEACGGSWSGPESVEEIMHSIKDGNLSKEIVEL